MTVQTYNDTPGSTDIADDAVADFHDDRQQSLWLSPSAWASFWAGFLAAFTISVGGEMPLGEVILVMTAGWAALCAIFNHALPGQLLRSRFLWILLAAQLIALGGYIFSDLYRRSSPHDMARGWSRMVFLAIDIIAVAYLFGRSRRNFLIFLLGQCLGDVASALIFGPMFGDMWKFGIGTTVTFLLFWLAPIAGPFVAMVAAVAIGVLHFALGYRSFSGLCLLAGMLMFLQVVPDRLRLWLGVCGAVAVVGVMGWVYGQMQSGNVRTTRAATRSDVERSSMMTAAIETIERSPLVGQGSWFSNSDFYDNFILIRHAAAIEAHVGGFPPPSKDPRLTALHSQILVAVAEGGLFGGAFFFVFGAGLLRALWDMVFLRRWHRLVPLHMLLLLSALWNLFASPFSGAHRVYIALACGLMLLMQQEPVAESFEERPDR